MMFINLFNRIKHKIQMQSGLHQLKKYGLIENSPDNTGVIVTSKGAMAMLWLRKFSNGDYPK